MIYDSTATRRPELMRWIAGSTIAESGIGAELPRQRGNHARTWQQQVQQVDGVHAKTLRENPA
jgi:hypothetical protein